MPCKNRSNALCGALWHWPAGRSDGELTGHEWKWWYYISTDYGSIMVPVASKNINMNTKENTLWPYLKVCFGMTLTTWLMQPLRVLTNTLFTVFWKENQSDCHDMRANTNHNSQTLPSSRGSSSNQYTHRNKTESLILSITVRYNLYRIGQNWTSEFLTNNHLKAFIKGTVEVSNILQPHWHCCYASYYPETVNVQGQFVKSSIIFFILQAPFDNLSQGGMYRAILLLFRGYQNLGKGN